MSGNCGLQPVISVVQLLLGAFHSSHSICIHDSYFHMTDIYCSRRNTVLCYTWPRCTDYLHIDTSLSSMNTAVLTIPVSRCFVLQTSSTYASFLYLFCIIYCRIDFEPDFGILYIFLMFTEYCHGRRAKYLLRYHLILVCKYRKACLSDLDISEYIKALSVKISAKHCVEILFMEVDKDHIHYMIQTSPNINLSNYVRILKQYTTYHLWEIFSGYLRNQFWHEKTFWPDGYFIASIGEVSSATLQQYIENQGKND